MTMTRVRIVGVLNVTPDSYHDGGKYVSVDAAVERAGAMLQGGADIIEVGGESTGPGSRDVGAQEEAARVVPVIEAVRRAFPAAPLSVDTYKSAVAETAIAAGVSMVNDVTAGRSDEKMFPLIARLQVPVVLMYAKDATARTTVDPVPYDDVVATIKAFLAERKAAAEREGIDPSRIILDPGLGHFVSSDPRYSFEILARLEEFADLGCPLFLSPSRKSFLAGAEQLKTVDRLPGTLAASAVAVLHGATYIRTHDVWEVRRACEIAEAIRASSPALLPPPMSRHW